MSLSWKPVLVLLMTVASVHADSGGIRKWFENFKQGLMGSAVESQYQRRRGVAAVAAVRGARQNVDDKNKPYWKGSAGSKQSAQLKKERAELAAAVDLALAGKTEEAMAAFDAFETAHPKSSLLPDVRQAREKLKALEEDETAKVE